MITLNHPNYLYVTRFKYLRNLMEWGRKRTKIEVLRHHVGRSTIPLSQELKLNCHYCSKRWNIKIIPVTWVDNNTTWVDNNATCIHICDDDKCKMAFLLASN